MEEENKETIENNKNEEPKILDKLKDETESLIKNILEQGINESNLDYLYKVVDIHKDIKNEEYWKQKEENEFMYGNYGRDSYGEYNDGGSYGRRGVPGTGRGRYREGNYNEGGYSESGSYGRRGVKGTGRGRYRGEEMMDEMMYHYGNYSEGMDNYGADQETMKSFKYMLKAFKDYYKHLKQEASSQEEVQLLEQTAKEISQM